MYLKPEKDRFTIKWLLPRYLLDPKRPCHALKVFIAHNMLCIFRSPLLYFIRNTL